MKDDNDILIEYYIVKDIIFNGVIYGTTAVILGEDDIFFKRALKKITLRSRLEHRRHMKYVGGKILCK